MAFISFEGTEGVGKTTLIKGIAQYLAEKNIDFMTTREPGGSVIAEEIRQLLLKPTPLELMTPDCELLLMFSARTQHIARTIQPALAQNKWVLCDRFIDATFAYQCGGRGISTEKVNILVNQFVPILPEITFWLDAEVEIGLARAMARAELDRFEQEKVPFFNRVRQVYQQRAEQEPTRFYRLDATQSADLILADAISALELRLLS